MVSKLEAVDVQWLAVCPCSLLRSAWQVVKGESDNSGSGEMSKKDKAMVKLKISQPKVCTLAVVALRLSVAQSALRAQRKVGIFSVRWPRHENSMGRSHCWQVKFPECKLKVGKKWVNVKVKIEKKTKKSNVGVLRILEKRYSLGVVRQRANSLHNVCPSAVVAMHRPCTAPNIFPHRDRVESHTGQCGATRRYVRRIWSAEESRRHRWRPKAW